MSNCACRDEACPVSDGRKPLFRQGFGKGTPSAVPLRAEKMRTLAPEGSVGQLVIAGGAAGVAVNEAVCAEMHLELGLAQNAEFFAPATLFRLLALGTHDSA